MFGDSGHRLQMFENFVHSFVKSSVVLGYKKLAILQKMKSMSKLLTLSHFLPEGINQLTHAGPLQLVGVRLKIKRMGNSSAYSSTVGIWELVIMQPASTQSIIQLTDFYYLVINYNYILTYN